MTELPLNQGQQLIGDEFFKFLLGTETELRISGPAGVGKTFLMNHMINKVMPQYYDMCKILGIPPEYDHIEMTATTNKAAAALSTATGRVCSTIHSFLGLSVRPDFNTGKTILRRTPSKWRMHEREIIFIDESSMIDRELRRQLYESTTKCKLIFVGDKDQLPPVFEEISEVYIDPKSKIYELLEPMRNNNQPALMALCSQLRTTVNTLEFKPIQIVPGVIDLLGSNQELTDKVEELFKEQTHDSRILAWSNDRVQTYNDHIRTLRGLPNLFQEGEELVVVSPVQFKNNALSSEETVIIDRILGEDKVTLDDGKTILNVQVMDIDSELHGPIYGVKVPTDYVHFHSLVKHYGAHKEFVQMYKLKDGFPELRQKDASTVHKAQGSTYETVIIDLNDISKCRKPNEVARLLYVAVSRPRTRIYLFGDLPEKYGGIIQ